MMFVETTHGTIRGKQMNGYVSFLGIPYAAPPVGKLRFRPPQPLRQWDGVRDCTVHGHAAPQNKSPLQPLQDDETMDEDCLYLNLHTPAADGEKRPIVIYIHGGAYIRGSGSCGPDPAYYTAQGIISVGVNYRLGILGFLQLDGQFGEEYVQSGNCGFLDMVAAIRWVRDNAERFGGDPDRITVMGQSAGAKAIAGLLLMPEAKGLFSRVILQSGATQCVRDIHTARQVTGRILEALELEGKDAPRLLEMPWQEFVRVQQTPAIAGFENLHLFGPVFDGVTFPGNDALEIIESGNANYVDILCGGNREEMALYHRTYGIASLTESDARGLFGKHAPLAMEQYQKRVPEPGNLDAFLPMLSDYLYFNSTVQMACAFARCPKSKPIYLYRMDWGEAAPYHRAFHGVELAFVMGIFRFTPDIRELDSYQPLAEKMSRAWSRFMESGIPQAEGLPKWPAFSLDKPEMMRFDNRCEVVPIPREAVEWSLPHQIFALHDENGTVL